MERNGDWRAATAALGAAAATGYASGRALVIFFITWPACARRIAEVQKMEDAGERAE